MASASWREALVRTVWYGEGFSALIGRALLTPFEWIYGIASAIDGARRAAAADTAPAPAVSVGNITVGGTGKTPISAWCAAQLRARGLSPAVLLRGYGDDEPQVHAHLNPDVPVHVGADRRVSAAEAIAQGATVLVLDDAFQHRQMPRDADVVLVSADLWSDVPVRLLPAGPFREPLSALRRANLVLVTRKAASAERATQVSRAVEAAAPRVPVAVAHLALDRLESWAGGDRESLEVLGGARVLAVCGIGAPTAFLDQLQRAGAQVDAAVFADHHAFTADDARTLAARGAAKDRVVCTLKDAVKLGPVWPAEAPRLWYLSQSVVIETGRPQVDALLDHLVRRTHSHIPAPRRSDK